MKRPGYSRLDHDLSNGGAGKAEATSIWIKNLKIIFLDTFAYEYISIKKG